MSTQQQSTVRSLYPHISVTLVRELHDEEFGCFDIQLVILEMASTSCVQNCTVHNHAKQATHTTPAPAVCSILCTGTLNTSTHHDANVI